MKPIDVSVPRDPNLSTYPGNTPFRLEAIKRIANGDSSNVSTRHFSAHGGTDVDAPRHFLDEGPGAEALPLEMRRGRARVIEITSQGITAEDPAKRDLSEDGRVLMETCALRHRGSPVDPGIYEKLCLPLPVAGSDGAPARLVLRRS